MDVVFLGTGNAFASGGRNAMAILLHGRTLGVLLDCGPTTLTALKKAALAPSDVDVVLLSHHHGDHFGGVPLLLCHERYEDPREKPLRIFGPPGTSEVIARTTELFFPGITPLPFPLEVTDLAPDEEHRSSGLELRTFEVDHYSNGIAFGYRVRMDERTVVFSGDTGWTEALVRESDGADLFICECSSFDEKIERHLSHRELALHESRIRARRTVLVHPGEDVIARANELRFPLATDGMRWTL
jgi:ribonuclease BN (tRNA processing enzyme)